MITSPSPIEFSFTVRIPASWKIAYPVASAFKTASHTVSQWRQRYLHRLALTKLDEHVLQDIGLDRASVAIESAKPFWRA